MRSFLRAAKTACLFVGSIVGAGFATGQEIALFFGGGSVLNLAIAAAFTGAAAFLFLQAGAEKTPLDPRIKTGADAVVALCSFVVYAAMIASAESVLQGTFGVKGLSLFVVTICSFLSAKSVKGLAFLNALAVPALLFLVIFVGVRAPFPRFGGEVRPLRSIAYGAMNMLFSGALMIEEGASLTKKERGIAALLCGGAIFVALFFIFRAIARESACEMPFLRAAQSAGLGAIAPVALILAIVTTMGGCDYLVSDRLNAFFRDPVFSSSLVALFGILLSLVGFVPIVKTAYPVVSYLGVAFTIALPFGNFFSRADRSKG